MTKGNLLSALWLISFVLLLSVPLHSQTRSRTLSGYVEDERSSERLVGVNVFIPGTTTGTVTNSYGFFSLTLPTDTGELAFSYVGYETKVIQLKKDLPELLTIGLEPTSTELDEVTVTAETPVVEQTQMSQITLSPKEIKQIPAFLGEVDVLRSLQYLPGVQSGNEGTTGLYVRGGSPDQNLILLDGVPVYNANHLFGFFSVFNADAIKSVTLTKGGFPSRYGGRLSSVIDITMKEGDMKEFHGEGAIGLIASRLTLEGPIWKDKTSFMISGRRTYLDVLTYPLMPAETKVGYWFGDLNAKVNHVFSDKDRLYLSFYGGRDRFYMKERYLNDKFDSRLQWGNRTGALRWNHLFSPKLFMNITGTYTGYRFEVGYDETYDNDEIGFRYFSDIRDWAVKTDLEYNLNGEHTLRFGGSAIFHQFKPGVVQYNEQSSSENIDSLINLSLPINAVESYLYVEDDYEISSKLRVNYGFHYSQYFVDDEFYHSFQPRISARYLFSNEWSVKGSMVWMQQYIHLLSNQGIGLPTDLWVSSTKRVSPQVSDQVALGGVFAPTGLPWEFSLEGYYKNMSGLIEYKEGASFFNTTDWQDNVVTGGRGWSYGAEVLIRKKEGKTTGWIGYTLSWSWRQFDELNQGKPYPYTFDRRHDVSVVINHKFSERFDIGLAWVYGTGNATNLPQAVYRARNFLDGYNFTAEYYGDRNSFRMDAYHRLDLGFNFHKKTDWGMSTWSFSVYNAYNRNNPFFLYIDQSYDQNKPNQVRQVSLFPLIPAFSWSFQF
ncbi:MAG: TonB-dependent receptor [Bacteroidota bacterium]|nr:TonB-dependent receptor [Bacteroidota bacterium]